MKTKLTIQRIDEILIQVSDVTRSLRFCRDGLKIPFEPSPYGDDSYQARVGDVTLLLHPDFDDSLKNTKRGAGILIHPWVPDADAYCDELRRSGIPIATQPVDRPWGRHFTVVDPDGYEIHILGPLRRERGP